MVSWYHYANFCFNSLNVIIGLSPKREQLRKIIFFQGPMDILRVGVTSPCQQLEAAFSFASLIPSTNPISHLDNTCFNASV